MAASIETTAAEIETFFGIKMTMALIKMPRYALNWSAEFRRNTLHQLCLSRVRIIEVFSSRSGQYD